MRNNPKISIILPIYNVYTYLDECLTSVLNQTYQEFEVLIIDDNSEAKNSKIIKEILAQYDKRFKYIYLEENKGPGAARNIGIKNSSGEYICLLDSDDSIAPNKLELTLKFLEKNPKYDMVAHRYKTIGKNYTSISSRLYDDTKKNKASFLKNASFLHPTTLIKKSAINKHNIFYPENCLCGEDQEFLYEFIRNPDINIAYINDILYFYRRHDSNISVTKNAIKAENINSLKRLYARIFGDFKLQYTDEELTIHWSLVNSFASINKNNNEKFKEIEQWMQKIINHNKQSDFFHQKILEETLANTYFEYCFNALKKYKFNAVCTFIKSPYAKKSRIPLKRWTSFVIKGINYSLKKD